MESVSVFWFRRDLRLEDNTGLKEALSRSESVLPLFIFDKQIIGELPNDDARITFIYDTLFNNDQILKKHNSSLLCLSGNPLEVWKELIQSYDLKNVYTNKDYEPSFTRQFHFCQE